MSEGLESETCLESILSIFKCIKVEMKDLGETGHVSNPMGT